MTGPIGYYIIRGGNREQRSLSLDIKDPYVQEYFAAEIVKDLITAIFIYEANYCGRV